MLSLGKALTATTFSFTFGKVKAKQNSIKQIVFAPLAENPQAAIFSIKGCFYTKIRGKVCKKSHFLLKKRDFVDFEKIKVYNVVKARV